MISPESLYETRNLKKLELLFDVESREEIYFQCNGFCACLVYIDMSSRQLIVARNHQQYVSPRVFLYRTQRNLEKRVFVRTWPVFGRFSACKIEHFFVFGKGGKNFEFADVFLTICNLKNDFSISGSATLLLMLLLLILVEIGRDYIK